MYRGASNKYFKNAIKKYGVQNFEIEKVLYIAHDRLELDTKERVYIKQYSSNIKGMGYNIDCGGTKRRPIVQLDKENNFFYEYSSIADACMETGILDFEISRNCRQELEIKGCQFMYKEEYEDYMRA